MSEKNHQELPAQYFTGRISRAQVLKAAAAAGLAAVAIPDVTSAAQGGTGGNSTSFSYFPQVPSGTYSPESVEEIVSNILTWAYLEVATVTFILKTPPLQATIGATGLHLPFLQAFNVELQSHIDFWSSVAPGAVPKATTFTVDPALFPGPKETLAVYDLASATRIAMMITAVREFAELGQPTLAKYAAQTLAMYGEDHGIVRTLGALAGVPGATPPNNKAFETDVFLYTREAVGVINALGLINGKGLQIPYPGRNAALAAAGAVGQSVLQRSPNDATSPFTFTGPASVVSERK